VNQDNQGDFSMSKINIKILEVDQDSHTVLVKYASEKSQKPIDEYPAVAFQVTNYNVRNLEEFVEAIRPQISLYVWQRDQAENPPTPVDISGWNDHSVEVDAYELPDPAAPAVSPINAFVNAEVTL
jgi:hypothetical protein